VGSVLCKFFEELFSDYVINVTVEKTERYGKEYKNKINFSVHPDDVRVLIGFLIFTGFISYQVKEFIGLRTTILEFKL
jgi:hypothetical protein